MTEEPRRADTDRYRQAIPRLQLSIERGTESVPEDGCFHVVLKGTEVFASASMREAEREYRQIRDDLLQGVTGEFIPKSPEMLARDLKGYIDAKALKDDAYEWRIRYKSRARGGRARSGRVS